MPLPTPFEERLLHQLRQVVAERPAPTPASGSAVTRRPAHRRRIALAGAGTAGVVGVTAAVALVAGSGGVTESAYAVTPKPDGSVTVKISSLSDADGLQRALRAAGVPAVVSYGGPMTCPAPGPGNDGGTVEKHDTAGGSAGARSLDSAGGEPAPGTAKGPKVTGGVATGPDGTTFTIDPGTLASGDKVYISTPDHTTRSLGLYIGKDEAGPCAPASPGH
jgi:hypothetical protein